MKKLSTYLSILAAAVVFMAGCTKVDPLPYYNDGSQVVVTGPKDAVAPALADSSKTVFNLSWTSPNYGTNPNTYKYIVEIDTVSTFASPTRREVIGKQELALTGKELNTILLNYGAKLGVSTPLYVRVISSYGNNNERYISKSIKVNATAYTDPSVLKSTATSVTPTLPTAGDNALTFSWTPSFSGYGGAVTYTLQYDTSANFTSAKEMSIDAGAFSKSITQGDINTAAINAGILGGSTGKLNFRVKATTTQGAVAYSNVLPVTIATFVPVPANLYIVGDATQGGWANPVPVPSQQFTKVDAYTFSLITQLTAGKSYLFLPENGSWDHKFGGASDGTAAAGDVLLKDGAVPGSNTPAPAVSGIYKITVNFQTNKYTVTKVEVPSNLYIVGDATAGGWDNPVPVPAQQFTKINDATFGIVTTLTAGKSYLFLPLNGNWDHKYGGATDGTSASGGVLLADGAVPGSNTPAPGATGLYKIIVNFATNSYTVTPFTGPDNLYIVGDATPGGWGNPVPVPSQQFTKLNNAEYELTIPLTAGKSYLFLPVNGSWDHKYGGSTDGTSAGGGILLADGAVPGSNTPAPAVDGTYKIRVNFLTNTYTVVKQ